ncbi:MAG TPA: hypothetical protein VL528_10705 [Oxalicibacterium sp.]|jgi:hypothetical protein|nr:hypothetical protein [Oxalicibacterium sp.]
MKTSRSRMAKRLAILLAAAGALGGCAVVPYDPGYGAYYGQPAYVAPAPVYVAPSVNFGFGYRSHGYYGGHHHRW